jgi:hypothetical protein
MMRRQGRSIGNGSSLANQSASVMRFFIAIVLHPSGVSSSRPPRHLQRSDAIEGLNVPSKARGSRCNK